jgi:hypothetical protein
VREREGERVRERGMKRRE